jgi:hypothetical protein
MSSDSTDAQPDDPWFAPGFKPDAHGGDANADGAAGGSGGDTSEAVPANGDAAGGAGARQAEWFLRTGRAGLLPDSMVVASDGDDGAGVAARDHHEVRVEAAGRPPWAGETTAVASDVPPPWENGPWPGPGGLRRPGSGGSGARHDETGWLASHAARDAAAAQSRWPPRTVVTAGLIPLVVPGLVLGILSLRQPGGRAIRKASWLAIGASMAWAAIIVLIVVGTSGGSAASCGGYPAAVHHAYEQALSDLNSHAPASVQAADLETAASLANASAAAAGQIGVRTALFTMANDMAQARADVVALRPIPATLQQHLASDGAVPSGSCVS